MTNRPNSNISKPKTTKSKQTSSQGNQVYPAYISMKASIIIFLAIYAIVFVTGWISEGYLSGIKDRILRSLAVDLVMTNVIYVFSFILQNNSVYDPFWFYGILVVAWHWFLDAGVLNYASILGITTITLYNLKFTQWFFYRQWTGLSYEDFRLKDVKRLWKKFPLNIAFWIVFGLIGYHWIASVIAFNGISPLYYAFYGQKNVHPEIVVLGFLIACSGIGIAFTADEQLHAWRLKNTGKCIDHGLWRYSRHPNYFGECTFWFGVFVLGIGCNRDALWTAVGFLTIVGVFTLVTIAWMEYHIKHKEGYSEYKKAVSRLVPWFRSEDKAKKQ